MRARHDVLVSGYDMGTSGTLIFNLDYSDIITAIELSFGATNGGTDNKNNPIERNITKIEIVDGSRVVYSLPGDVAYALYSQLHGSPAQEYHSGCVNDSPSVSIPILFGRRLYDVTYGLNPAAFRNLQLKVTFDEATVRAAGATGFVSDSFSLTILTHLMEDVSPPSAVLVSKDIYDFTSVGSGDVTVDMPTDMPYRLLMVRAYEAGTDLRSSITNMKLNCDGGRFIPFDLPTGQIIELMTEVFPCTHKAGYETADDGDTVQTWMGFDLGQAIHAAATGYIVGAGGFWPGQFSVQVTSHEGASTDDIPVRWRVDGYAPHNLFVVPFGDLDVAEHWFDARAYGNVKLYLTNGDADAEVNVCLQQVLTY